VKDGGIYREKAVYIVIGVSIKGMKELLGMYIGETESASFRQTVCSDLSQRGVEDVFITCTDGLSGFSKAIKNIFPNATIQKCIIHQIRNSLKHVSYKDYKAFVQDLKNIYQSPNLETAETNLCILEEKRGKKYSLAVKSRFVNRTELSTYFAYPDPIRKLIYTTNTIEGFNRQIRKSTKNRPSFPDDTALMKILYLVSQRITKKWITPVHNR
jgi:transposase-like protein